METKHKQGPEDTTSITGVKKRQSIDRSGRIVFVWVTIASVVVTVAIILAQAVFKQMMFNNKVTSAYSKTNSTIVKNIKSYDTLRTEVGKLIANKELTALRVMPEDTAVQVVIDALPTTNDTVSLAASLQQSVLARSGVKIESITFVGSDATTTTSTGISKSQSQSTQSSLAEIPFIVQASGSYEVIQRMISDMSKSIRPISIQNVKLSGASTNMQVQVQAKTYYAVPPTIDLGKETIGL